MKRAVRDLACFGGRPLFETVRPIGQLSVPDEDRFFELMKPMFDGWCGGAPNVETLESRLRSFHCVGECVAYANASLAIVALLSILSEGRRGEVIMPAFTYAGLPHLARWARQRPRFCDIDADTHTLAPATVDSAISLDTTAILAVHQVNSPCEIDELQAIADRSGIPLIFDSVHGIGCTYRGKPIGGFGRAEVFSLHATKLLNGFEGGYVTTNDSRLAHALRVVRDQDRIDAEADSLAMNGRLNEMHAACALASMDQMPALIAGNHERYLAYRESFDGIPGLDWVRYPENGEQFNYEFALLKVLDEFPLSRDSIVTLLRKENAWARAYYSPPLHQSEHCPPGVVAVDLPVTESCSRSIIQMPVGERVGRADIDGLASWFRFLHQNADEISALLERAGSKA